MVGTYWGRFLPKSQKPACHPPAEFLAYDPAWGGGRPGTKTDFILSPGFGFWQIALPALMFGMWDIKEGHSIAGTHAGG